MLYCRDKSQRMQLAKIGQDVCLSIRLMTSDLLSSKSYILLFKCDPNVGMLRKLSSPTQNMYAHFAFC